MTTSTNRIEDIFQDARELQAAALAMLAQGRIRNAAGKAWGATKRATDALVLAEIGLQLPPLRQTHGPALSAKKSRSTFRRTISWYRRAISAASLLAFWS